MSKLRPAPDCPEPAVDPAAARAERRLDMLNRLADKALALAEAVPEDGSARSVEVFAQLSHSLRQTLLLKAKFEEGPGPRTAGKLAQAEDRATKAAAAPNSDADDPFARLITAPGSTTLN